MRRVSTIAVPLALLALVLTGVAAAGNAGFAPEPPHSPNAARVTDAYWLIFGFTAAIFLIVEGALVAFVLKYRSRGRARTVEGAQVHGNNRLELIWTVIPVVILAIIAGFVFYKLPGISDVPAASAADRVDVRIDAHQYYWQFTYPDGAISIDTLHVPAGKVVDLHIHSEDVNHSWWVPQLGGKMDAIAGRVNHTWFDADKTGTFYGQCAEFCGLYHAAMKARVIATDDTAYRTFLAAAPAQLGRSEFDGVCAKCHGNLGQGGYGPPLAGNPEISNYQSISTIVRNGRSGPQGTMPAVGIGWSTTQMKALVGYLKTHLKGGTVGG